MAMKNICCFAYGVRRLLTVLAVSNGLSAYLVEAQVSANTVPPQDSRNIDILNTNSHLSLPIFSTLESWEQRKVFLRNQILVSAGLSPMPERTPLHAQIFGKVQMRDYSIEKVLIETMPGLYLGGNLYRPRDNNARHPGVLNPHGHWPYGRLENQSLYSGPSFGISLARQGYVVFAYDMVGYTDTIQLPHHFGSAEQRLWSFGPLGLQLWNSIRALDFLASLDGVDPARLGIAGASGGGTQTFLLAAIDDRIQFSSPVNMVSAIMQGGDLCENAPGLRINTSNVEIAALFAPRPMLLVSATGDWTHNVPHDEFPAIQKIYELYGKANQVDVVQIDEVHNFNRLSREAVYRFFARVNPGLSERHEMTEHDISVPMLQEMTVLSNRSLPADALDAEGIFRTWRESAQAQNRQTSDRALLLDRLRHTLAVEVPSAVAVELSGTHILLSRPNVGDRLPGVWIEGHGKPAIVVHPQGSAVALTSDLVRQLRQEGRTIFIPDVFQTGAAAAPRPGDPTLASFQALSADSDDEERADTAAGHPKFLTFNVSVDAARVQDIVTALTYVHKSGPEAEVYANGDAALWAIFAAALSPSPVSLHLKEVPTLNSDADYLAHFNVPGILRSGGVDVAKDLAGYK